MRRFTPLPPVPYAESRRLAGYEAVQSGGEAPVARRALLLAFTRTWTRHLPPQLKSGRAELRGVSCWLAPGKAVRHCSRRRRRDPPQLKLKRDALRDLDLPITLTRGHIGRIAIRVPFDGACFSPTLRQVVTHP